jgi:hypothetical protein
LNFILLMVSIHAKRVYNAGYNQELRNDWPEIASNQSGILETDEAIKGPFPLGSSSQLWINHKLSEIFFFAALTPDFTVSKNSSAASLKSPAE